MRDLVVQSKRNSEDVHSYLTDLEGWQRDMEAKDNQLRGKTSEPTGLFSMLVDSFPEAHHTMRQVPLKSDINIAVKECSGFATSTKIGPFMAMLILRSRGTYLIVVK